MKNIIAAIALLATTLPALAQTQLDPRTQEYRMWSADQMVTRLVVRLGRTATACNDIRLQAFFPKLSDACKEAVISTYPRLKVIREIAAGGDDVEWAFIIDAVHEFEDGNETALSGLERK